MTGDREQANDEVGPVRDGAVKSHDITLSQPQRTTLTK
jgi:hypothetical protein